jgi:hypothetical protein
VFGSGTGEGHGTTVDAERTGGERAGHDQRTRGDPEGPLAAGRLSFRRDFLGLVDQLPTNPERVTIPT